MRSWIPDSTDARVSTAVAMALGDVGEHEVPMGSNRGAFVDAVNAASGSPRGSYWCANVVARWWRAAGLALPPVAGACEQWRLWGRMTGRLSALPVLGAVILYGTHAPLHASHCGLVVCVDPLFVVEGNTTLEGYSRNGDVVTLKAPVAPPILGFVHPLPVTS